MLRLTPEQRRMLVDKLPDLANVAVAALVFGQLLSDGPFSGRVALIGGAMWFALVGFAFFLGGRKRT